MKKIKEYLSTHKTLNKCLKILGVVGICLSVLFNALIIGVAIANKVNNNKNNDIQPSSNKVVHNLANYEDLYYISSFSDYSTIDFLLSVLEYEDSEGYTHFKDADGVHQTIYFYDEVYRINLNDLDFSNLAQTPMYYSLQYVDYWGTISNNAYTDRYVKFDFMYNNTEWYFTCTYRTFNLYNATDPDSLVLKGDLTNTLIRFNYSDTLAPYFDLGMFAYRYGMNSRQLQMLFKFNRYEQSYDDARYEGYREGYTTGLQVGHDAGYQEGLDASEGYTNVFTIIANAFDAVASVLNIELLPHLTLGTIVFAPIVITLIIVLVKMIRG